ncbi:hypothetical protein MNBD_GAMMA15-757 [hydrothermal vent metagenome]|uniref:General secretion pathway GspH domain-containing protein n=1 Tax=hydrothermal vent metagenome TaxID=652676 RepID=A0A3B0YGI9_9ZZZZ
MDDAQHEGFTLVELLVVLAIAALLIGIAAPAMARFLDNARLRAATEDIARELVQARSHAITFNTPIYFTIAATGSAWCYGWGEVPDCDCISRNTEAACRTGEPGLTQLHRQTSTDYPQIRLSLPANQGATRLLRFSPIRGTATATSFSLENSNNETRVILSLLGRIRICSPEAAGYLTC